MEFLALVIYVLIGGIAGLLAGLLGISGGVITVPCLMFVFRFLDFPSDILIHMAIGTSLSAMVFNAITSAWAHERRGAVLWKLVIPMVPGLLLGSIIGSLVARVLPDLILKEIFAIFECLIGIYFFLPYKEKTYEDLFPMPRQLGLNLIGFGIGGLSSLLGIGGGIITVPILLAIQVPVKKAIGTSAATGFLITLTAAIAYLFFGLGKVTHADSIGYLYLPAFLIISIVTAFTAPYGAKLAHVLPTPLLRRIFAVALFLAGILMFF